MLPSPFYFIYCTLKKSPGSSVSIANELRAGRSGIESRWGRDFPPVQTGPGAHPTSCKMSTRSFPGVKCGRGVLLTTHPLLVPQSWKSRAIPLPTSGPHRACNGIIYFFTVTLKNHNPWTFANWPQVYGVFYSASALELHPKVLILTLGTFCIHLCFMAICVYHSKFHVFLQMAALSKCANLGMKFATFFFFRCFNAEMSGERKDK